MINPLTAMILLAFLTGNVLAENTHNYVNVGVNLDVKKAGSHGVIGTRTNIAIQPLDKHRIKFDRAYFGNDNGASSSGTDDGTSFGSGDFFDCLFKLFGLFGSCSEDGGNSVTSTGGNYFYEYEESNLIYQYQLSKHKTSETTFGEVWGGLGISHVEVTKNQYQINNGENFDFVSSKKEKGIALELDYVSRHKNWYWEASLFGSTASESYGTSLGVGLGF